MKTLALELPAPLQDKGRPIQTLTLREPITRHVRQAELKLFPGHGQADLRKFQITLIASVAGLPEAEIGKLPVSLINRSTQWLQPMIERLRQTGPFDQPDTMLLTLDPPVELSNRTVSDLYLREPTGKEMELAESHMRGQFGPGQVRAYEVALVARVAGVSEAVIDSLLISQHNEAIQFIENFFNAARETGES